MALDTKDLLGKVRVALEGNWTHATLFYDNDADFDDAKAAVLGDGWAVELLRNNHGGGLINVFQGERDAEAPAYYEQEAA